MGKDDYANNVCANFLRLIRAKGLHGFETYARVSMYDVAGDSGTIIIHVQTSFARVCINARAYVWTKCASSNARRYLCLDKVREENVFIKVFLRT